VFDQVLEVVAHSLGSNPDSVGDLLLVHRGLSVCDLDQNLVPGGVSFAL